MSNQIKFRRPPRTSGVAAWEGRQTNWATRAMMQQPYSRGYSNDEMYYKAKVTNTVAVSPTALEHGGAPLTVHSGSMVSFTACTRHPPLQSSSLPAVAWDRLFAWLSFILVITDPAQRSSNHRNRLVGGATCSSAATCIAVPHSPEQQTINTRCSFQGEKT
jgi:hypothetical protein